MLSKILSFLKYLNQDMPLEKSKGFDDYWDNRKEMKGDIGKLSPHHRKRILAEKLIEDNAKILDIGCGTASLYDAFIFCREKSRLHRI